MLTGAKKSGKNSPDFSDMADKIESKKGAANGFLNDVLLKPSQGSYWAVRYPIGRGEYALKYVALPLIVFAFFVLLPLYVFAPEIFSAASYNNMGESARAILWEKLPIAVMIIAIPAIAAISMAIIGQIKRLKNLGISPWLAMLNILPFAIFFIALFLCVLPDKKDVNNLK